jgi:hypothetical protein
MVRSIAEYSVEACVPYREPDFVDELGALEEHGGFDFELIQSLPGRRLIDRWAMRQLAIDEMGGTAAYPMFERLVAKVRTAD